MCTMTECNTYTNVRVHTCSCRHTNVAAALSQQLDISTLGKDWDIFSVFFEELEKFVLPVEIADVIWICDVDI